MKNRITPEMLAQRSRVISEHFDVQKKSDYLGEGELIPGGGGGGGGGTRVFFWVGMCRLGLQIWTPF